MDARKKLIEPNRFYGDPVERFRLMAKSSSEQPIDAAHFRMWCNIAADEIEYARARAAMDEKQP
jgi:hypothetical protein